MTPADLDGVVAVARVGFPDHFEDRVCFENRLALYPQGCSVLAGEQGVGGYCVAYPWTAGAAPPLNSLCRNLPEDAATLYLHDLALSPNARGGGRARAGVDRVVDLAERGGWATVSLVAVNAAEAFWQGQGFATVATPDISAKLASYGSDARYMVRRL